VPSIHFRKTVDAPADEVYAALATQDGLAGNWTDQLEVPEQTCGVAGASRRRWDRRALHPRRLAG
jgi:uncharacterized protein YndB with AHSA1/START domain